MNSLPPFVAHAPVMITLGHGRPLYHSKALTRHVGSQCSRRLIVHSCCITYLHSNHSAFAQSNTCQTWCVPASPTQQGGDHTGPWISGGSLERVYVLVTLSHHWHVGPLLCTSPAWYLTFRAASYVPSSLEPFARTSFVTGLGQLDNLE